MTVPAGVVPIVTMAYSGPGDYPFEFRVFHESDVVVSLTDLNGVKTPLSYGEPTGYSITLVNGGLDGGVCVATNPATTGSLEIIRTLETKQPVEWHTLGLFDLDLLEDSLDYLTLLIQSVSASVTMLNGKVSLRGVWGPNIDYVAGDLVTSPDNFNWYLCQTNHKSGTTFATDLSTGKWLLGLDIEAIAALTSAAAQSEAISAQKALDAQGFSVVSRDSMQDAIQASDSARQYSGEAYTSRTSAAADATRAENAVKEAESIVAVGERVDSMKGYPYTATAGQVDFAITNPAPEDNIIVFMNSRFLTRGDDYTLNSAIAASIVSLNEPAKLGDEIFILSFNVSLVGPHSMLSAPNGTAILGVDVAGATLHQGDLSIASGNVIVDGAIELPGGTLTGARINALVSGGMIGQQMHSHSGLRFQDGTYGVECSLTNDRVEVNNKDLRVGSSIILSGAYTQTTDPHVAGMIWNNGGIPTFSAG